MDSIQAVTITKISINKIIRKVKVIIIDKHIIKLYNVFFTV